MPFVYCRSQQEIAARKTLGGIGAKARESHDTIKTKVIAKRSHGRAFIAIATDQKKADIRLLRMNDCGGTQKNVRTLLFLQRADESHNGRITPHEAHNALLCIRPRHAVRLERVDYHD